MEYAEALQTTIVRIDGQRLAERMVAFETIRLSSAWMKVISLRIDRLKDTLRCLLIRQ